MSKSKALVAFFGFVLAFSFVAGLGSVKAEAIFPVLMSPVHIESPINRTYTPGPLMLNAGFGGLCFNVVKHSLTYSLDGVDMGALTIIPHYPDYLSVQANYAASVQLPPLSMGQHVVTVYAKHSAYNITINGVFHPEITQRDSSTVIFRISDKIPINELTPPVISNFTVENRTYPSKNLSVNFNVDKSVMWTGYNLDDKDNTTITGYWNTAEARRVFNFTLKDLTDGNHSLVAYAQDTFENFGASEMVNFAVDTIAPNVTVLSFENQTYNSANVPLNFTVNESVSPITYSLDGKENVTVSGNSTLTGLSNGAHNVTVYGWDAAGNVGCSQTAVFNVDAPVLNTMAIAVSSALAVVIIGVGPLVYRKKRKHQGSN